MRSGLIRYVMSKTGVVPGTRPILVKIGAPPAPRKTRAIFVYQAMITLFSHGLFNLRQFHHRLYRSPVHFAPEASAVFSWTVTVQSGAAYVNGFSVVAGNQIKWGGYDTATLAGDNTVVVGCTGGNMLVSWDTTNYR